MPDEHAILSPSSAERWAVCPGSVRLSADVPNESSIFAEEGTHAHAYGELRLRRIYGFSTEGEDRAAYSAWLEEGERRGYDIDEMIDYVERYVDFVQTRFDYLVEAKKHPKVFVEQRVQTGIPECWGTADCVIVADDLLEVIDLKYGKGVKVTARDNMQLRLYGVGGLEMFDLGDIREVSVSICQPRIDNFLTVTHAASDLYEFRDALIPIAEDALAGSDVIVPSEDGCRWCPVAGECRARMEASLKDVFNEDRALLSDEEIAEILQELPAIKSWIAAFEKHALDMVYSGSKKLPGWKVVRARGRRVISNEERAIHRLVEDGFSLDEITTTKVKGITELERLVGKKSLPSVLGDALEYREGNPTLAPDDDPREEVTNAGDAKDAFDDEQ